MKELPDSEFDRLFKEKSSSFDYSFEEEAWGLMEKKLRRRDRFVFIRNASAVLLLLMFTAGGSYYLLKQDSGAEKLAGNKPHKEHQKIEPGKKQQGQSKSSEEILATDEIATSMKPQHDGKNEAGEDINETYTNNTLSRKKERSLEEKQNQKRPELAQKELKEKRKSANPLKDQPAVEKQALTTDYPYLATIEVKSAEYTVKNPSDIETDATSLSPEARTDRLVNPGKIHFTLSLAAGPDFSSVDGLAGRKANLNTGLLLNASFKKYTLSAGARYGVKTYSAESYNYNVGDPSRARLITGIDGSCNVLELPLQLSYQLLSDTKKQINLIGGISSYLMLKEQYLFKYSPESGYKDYLLKKTNENQHYFSVLNLGALYQFKPISSNVTLGVEPYVKIPLGGVGAGNVKLKSSGISLNLTYELSKTH